MIFEVCIDSIDGALVAQKHKVQRVELCSALTVGGLTPNYGLIAQCVQETSVEVHVMIRHVQGGFVFSDDDIEIMQNDISTAQSIGAKGVVFGCLTDDNRIDIDNNKRLIDTAKSCGLVCTFHRAFDFCENPFIALEQIIEFGFDRILTSGLQETAIAGIDLITALVSKAEGRIEIMAGSGVNSTNALQLANTGIDALHFTAHQTTNYTELGMGNKTIVDEEKIASIINIFNY
jgi:copper homeostasis protein